jgi:hypothetical protein
MSSFFMLDSNLLSPECHLKIGVVGKTGISLAITAGISLIFWALAFLKTRRGLKFKKAICCCCFFLKKERETVWSVEKGKRELWESISSAFDATGFVLLPATRLVVLPFDCSQTAEGSYVLDAEPSVVCYGGSSDW